MYCCGLASSLIKVQRNVAQLLLNVATDFTLGCWRERIALFRQPLHHLFCEITSSKVQQKDYVR